MKTKKIFSILVMLILSVTTMFVISSCSKDDVSEDGYSIIGTWKYSFGSPSDYVLLTFNVNGTGRSVEFDDGEIDGDETFRYSYAENVLTVYYDDGYKETVLVNWQNKNKFLTSWYDQVDTWIRQ